MAGLTTTLVLNGLSGNDLGISERRHADLAGLAAVQAAVTSPRFRFWPLPEGKSDEAFSSSGCFDEPGVGEEAESRDARDRVRVILDLSRGDVGAALTLEAALALESESNFSLLTLAATKAADGDRFDAEFWAARSFF